MINWTLEVDNIKGAFKLGHTVADVAKFYGIGTTRLYQVMNKLDITPPERRAQWLRELTDGEAWLYYILAQKGLRASSRRNIVDAIDMPDHCPVLGTELNYIGDGRQGHAADKSHAPSVWLKDVSLGYTADNIIIVSWKVSQCLRDRYTPSELEAIAQFMRTSSHTSVDADSDS